MGVLKNITDEYFGNSERDEDKITTNVKDMHFIDMGGTVLWSDRDFEVVNDPKNDIQNEKFFTFENFCKIRLGECLRLPTRKEFRELENGNIDINMYKEIKTDAPDIVFVKNGDWDNSLWFYQELSDHHCMECRMLTSDESDGGSRVFVACLDELQYDLEEEIQFSDYRKGQLRFRARLVKDKNDKK